MRSLLRRELKYPRMLLGSFDQQQFRIAAVMWLVENNHPIREFVLPSFREKIQLANPAAADALWVSHNSVSAFAMKLFSALQPRVIAAIAGACSKIHNSFDGWTTKTLLTTVLETTVAFLSLARGRWSIGFIYNQARLSLSCFWSPRLLFVA